MSSTRPQLPRRHHAPRAPRRFSIPVTGGLWPLVAGICVVFLLGLIVWNLNLRDDVASLQRERDAAVADSAALRQRANATVYQLLPTSNIPDNANAQAWFSVQGSGVLSVANMPALPKGSVYQLWYGTDDPSSPIPGGTFTVDQTGQGFMLIPADVGIVSSISITQEREGGSQAPNGPVLLESNIDGARG